MSGARRRHRLGFTAETARRLKREFLRCPIAPSKELEGIAVRLDVQAAK